MPPKKLTKDQIQNTLGRAIQDAVDFVSSEIAPLRIKSQRYFEGKADVPHEEGRNKVVSTKARDAVRAVMPALMRLFLQSGKPVEFSARNPRTANAADQATKYAQMIFERNNGFMALRHVVQDALVKKTGIIKCYYDEEEDTKIDHYTGITPEQFMMLASDPANEVIEVEAEQEETGEVLIEATIQRKSARGEIKFEPIAPEDFFIDRAAKDINRFYVCGHSTEGRVGDLVEMGFDFEEVLDLAGVSQNMNADAERQARSEYSMVQDDQDATDPSMKKVLITEAYMRMDIEGTGVPVLYKFICAGLKYKVLDYEQCDYQPFCIFEIDPEPHTFFGRSLVEIVFEDQDTATALLRGLLDSIMWLNNPSLEVVSDDVNMDDVLNNEFGQVVRVKRPGMIRELAFGAAASAALPAMQYHDETVQRKTGIVGAGMGLDVDALSSQTAAGVRMADQMSNAVAELMARTLAEGGMKQLFRTIAQLARQNPNPGEMIRVDGQFIPVDPSSWSADMDMVVNVGIGTGRHEERLMALNQVLQYQLQAIQMGGANNGLVGLTEVRNALVDAAALGGVMNGDRYFKQMNPQIEQQLAQQAAQAAQQQGSDPNQAYLQAEMAKVQQKAQSDVQKAQITAMKAQADTTLKAQQMRMDDDLERDRMAQDLALKSADLLGKYQLQVNQQAVRAQQAMPRPPV